MNVEHRLAGADPGGFGMIELDVKACAAFVAAIRSRNSSPRRGAQITGRRMKTA